MRKYPFKLVNVFAESHFGGNPLAVFPQAGGLTDEEMQQIAKQFNLSETVFILPSEKAAAKLRIFTPSYEMPFAGHPTLGAAFVLQQAVDLGENFALETPAKIVQLQSKANEMAFQMSGYTFKTSSADKQTLAELAGLAPNDIADAGYYVNSGVEYLLVQVNNDAAVAKARVSFDKLKALSAENPTLENLSLYVWFMRGNQIHSRMFFEQDGLMLEDCGTGSACANLGAFFLSQGKRGEYRITQGVEMGRPNALSLRIADEQIFVGGKVIEVGEGIFKLP